MKPLFLSIEENSIASNLGIIEKMDDWDREKTLIETTIKDIKNALNKTEKHLNNL